MSWMNKEQWKKVFGSIRDEQLVDLCKVWDVKVKGFRTLTKQNVKQAKKRLMTELVDFRTLRPIIEFYQLAAVGGEHDGGKGKVLDIQVRDATIPELIQAYEDGEELHFLLGGLFSSEDVNHHALADEFLEALLTQKNVQSIEQLLMDVVEEKDVVEREESSAQGTKQIEKKIEKAEAKNQKLQQQISEWEQQYSKLKQEFKEEKQQWIKERAQLQQEIGNEKKACERVQEANETSEDEKQKLKDEIVELKAKIAHLHTQILHSTKQAAVTIAHEEKTEATQEFTILLIGDPKNKMIHESTNPVFHVVDPRNQEALEEMEVRAFNEIWMLDYLVPFQLRKKWMTHDKDEMKHFKNFNEVKTYVAKGRK
ncbi:cell division protein FtsB [Bacillus iocasae]|uniref:Cell division protein FtsB n=2 Tax=Priestia iocasae TaxID=2291674 RepID=A0ABS2QZD1_9BACI|nr:hypothetical protein [Metabacillus iocasae]MBM7704362.1 cell division protein FtsB [Metabacillus iocasae]